MKSLRFNTRYFFYTILLFITEVLIAVFLNDPIIRPYIGDVLVVMLIYCFVRSFFNTPVVATALWVMVFAYFIEFTQYIHLVNKIGLKNSALARTVMGTSFAWTDLLCYTAGTFIILLLEKAFNPKI